MTLDKYNSKFITEVKRLEEKLACLNVGHDLVVVGQTCGLYQGILNGEVSLYC